MQNECSKYAAVFKALSDETRLKIVDLLSCEELCACKILERFSITQPTLSYHMKILTECGIVLGKRDGAWMHYRINKDMSEGVAEFLKKLLDTKQDCSCMKCSGRK